MRGRTRATSPTPRPSRPRTASPSTRPSPPRTSTPRPSRCSTTPCPRPARAKTRARTGRAARATRRAREGGREGGRRAKRRGLSTRGRRAPPPRRPVDRSLKISLYLNRAENRLTRLQPLHRAAGWEARDEAEWERSQRDFLRDALRDCDFALCLSEDCAADDIDKHVDARPWVKRAKVAGPRRRRASSGGGGPRRSKGRKKKARPAQVKVALGDLASARDDLKVALKIDGKDPKIAKTAARVYAAIKAQEAKERAFYSKISDLSVISQ